MSRKFQIPLGSVPALRVELRPVKVWDQPTTLVARTPCPPSGGQDWLEVRRYLDEALHVSELEREYVEE